MRPLLVWTARHSYFAQLDTNALSLWIPSKILWKPLRSSSLCSHVCEHLCEFIWEFMCNWCVWIDVAAHSLSLVLRFDDISDGDGFWKSCVYSIYFLPFPGGVYANFRCCAGRVWEWLIRWFGYANSLYSQFVTLLRRSMWMLWKDLGRHWYWDVMCVMYVWCAWCMCVVQNRHISDCLSISIYIRNQI